MLDSSKVMGKWGKAYLPTWLIALRYSSVTSWKTIVSNMIPVTHYGKSRLKKKQLEAFSRRLHLRPIRMG